MSSSLGGKFTVAISRQFFEAFAKIPRNKQMKVTHFIDKFERCPDSHTINYEQISDFKDKNLRSVRIDLEYRAIILRPEQGNVFVLMYVDHHDEAYRWARNKVARINPESGGLQVIDVESVTELSKDVLESSAPSKELSARFSNIKDKQLLRLGIPAEFLPALRQVRTDRDVEKLCTQLPDEASDALYMLAAGYDLDQVYNEVDKSDETVPIDTQDFAAALAAPDSMRTFWVVENEAELSAALAAPLDHWRVFLHPSQRKIVTSQKLNGPARVLGGAGTGKTVVAMHRAKWLVENKYTAPQDRILFTTFTANLAADIKANLAKICRLKDMTKIEVVNIDKWVFDFLKRNGYKRDLATEKVSDELWELAYSLAPEEPNFDLQFYREEWEKVIQPNGVTDKTGYLKVSRAGRGISLARKDRDAIWIVFEEYRELLTKRGLKEITDATRDACQLLEKQGDVLPYKAIILDEAQDMGPETFKLIRQIMNRDGEAAQIFIVGDAHQRIYGRQATLSSCGIYIRGRARKLKINYRTTEETRRWAVNLLKDMSADDLDGDADDLKGYQSKLHGNTPNVNSFGTFEEEVDFLCEAIRNLQSRGVSLSDVCVVGRDDRVLERYEKALQDKKFSVYRIRRSVPDERNVDGLRCATMHRVKGLQFEYVFLIQINDRIVPPDHLLSKATNEVSRREIEHQERRLLHVAATRAKRDVTITSFGTPSKLLR